MNDQNDISISSTAFYADISDPQTQSWLQRSLLEQLPADQLYLTTCQSESRNVIKQLLLPNYHTIMIIGSDTVLESFINTYRELNPNPTKQLRIGFVPVGYSVFAAKTGIALPPHALFALDRLAHVVQPINFPELHAHLCLYISAGRLRSSILYLPQTIRRHFMHTPLSHAMPGMFAVTCLNEAPSGCALLDNHFIDHRLAQDQIIFNKRLLTLRILPSFNIIPSSDHAQNHYFEIHTQSIVSPHTLFSPLSIQSEHYLCQRTRLDFMATASLKTAASVTNETSATITLSSRSFFFIKPHQTLA